MNLYILCKLHFKNFRKGNKGIKFLWLKWTQLRFFQLSVMQFISFHHRLTFDI